MKRTDPSHAERIGEVLAGRYRVKRFLGGGGMGAVFEAHHISLNRRFAVKFLRARYGSNPDMVARFRAEARVAGGIEADNVVAVVDEGEAADGIPYLVMEYLEGETLAGLMERHGSLPVPRAAGAIAQACRGVACAHEAGVIHRDIKPANLFVTRRGDGTDLIKVLDFGVAKLKGELAEGAPVTKTGSVLGTSHYLAPEQARGEKSVTPQTDVYALGVTLYEALSGRRPHPGESHNQIIYHILTNPPEPLSEHRPELPDELVAIVRRAMAFEPEDRYASPAQLADALEPHASLRGERAGSTATGDDTLSDQDNDERRWAADSDVANSGTGVTAELKKRATGQRSSLYLPAGIALGLLVLAYAASGWFSPNRAGEAASTAESLHPPEAQDGARVVLSAGIAPSPVASAMVPPGVGSASPPLADRDAGSTHAPASSEPARAAPAVPSRFPVPSKPSVTFERDNPYR